MRNPRRLRHAFGSDNGSVLIMVAGGIVVLLAVCSIAIDLANFYLARAQAQRAADAAALAGAKSFVTTGCITGGCVAGGVQETLARQQAVAAAAQNYIAGRAASIKNSNITFNYPNPEEPQITVVAKAVVSTFFAKIFGIASGDISATATAEAYNPAGGGGAPLATACLKPFLVPDCDPIHTGDPNNLCADPGQGHFFDSTGAIVNPGVYPAGIVGMPWQLHSAAAPSQWYLVGFTDAPPSSGSALRRHIMECTADIYTCGTTLTTANGAKVGPVSQGIEELINANGDGLNQGQDSIDTTIGPPFPITGGSNNPNPNLRGKVFYDYSESPSAVTVPVYAGNALSPGGSNVQVVGYMQIFIRDVVHSGSDNHIDVIILNAASCGGSPSVGGGSPTPPVVAAGGSPIPIRLIRTD